MYKRRNSPSTIRVSIGGGLGNQLFQLATGLAVARGRKILLERDLMIPRLNHEDEPELCSFRLPSNVFVEASRRKSLFVMRSTNFMLLLGKSAFRNPGRLVSNLLKLASSFVVSCYFREITRLEAARGIGFHEIESSTKRIFLVGYFQSFRWALEPDTYETLRGMTIEQESEELQSWKTRAKLERPLVVHVRLGDYRQIPTFGIPSVQYYSDAIERMWQSGEFGSIWVFTNEIEIAKDYLPASIVERCCWVPEINQSAAQTLELMRCGHGFVIANSTFSWWGAFLAHKENVPVIAPQPWFQGEASPLDLIPPNWQSRPARRSEPE